MVVVSAGPKEAPLFPRLFVGELVVEGCVYDVEGCVCSSVWPDVVLSLQLSSPLRVASICRLCSEANCQPSLSRLCNQNDSAWRLDPERSLIGLQANALLLLVRSFTGKGTQERRGTIAIGRSEEGVKRFSQEYLPSKFLQHKRLIAYIGMADAIT